MANRMVTCGMSQAHWVRRHKRSGHAVGYVAGTRACFLGCLFLLFLPASTKLASPSSTFSLICGGYGQIN